MIKSLTTWLDGFMPWAQVAASLGRPVPDLGFWPADSQRLHDQSHNRASSHKALHRFLSALVATYAKRGQPT